MLFGWEISMERLYRYYNGTLSEKDTVSGIYKVYLDILTVAKDKREAKKRYKECLIRNSIPLEVLKFDPGICELVGAEEMMNDHFTEEMKAELANNNSVLYHVDRKVLNRILSV